MGGIIKNGLTEKKVEGIDPVVMADLSGVGIIDYIAFIGRLNTLYDIAVVLCEDRHYDEIKEEVVFGSNMRLEDVE